METGLKRSLVAVIWIVVSSSFAFASQTCVLIDRSGSMRNHYESVPASESDLGTPLVPALAEAMGSAASVTAAPDYAMFDVAVAPAPGGIHDPEFHVTGKDTRLTDALRTMLKSHRYVWLLTDNVEDFGSDTDMSQFYALLHTPDVRQVRIFMVL